MSSYRVFPESLQAWKNGWKEIGDNDKEALKTMLNDEFVDETCSESLQNTLKCIAGNMDGALLRRGQDINSVTCFQFLIYPAMNLLVDFTCQHLVKSGKSPISLHEMWEFLETMMMRSAFNVSPELSWKLMEKHADGFDLMKLSRFNEILSSLRGYDVNARDPDDWMCKSNMLRNMNQIEVLIFERSVSTLLNKKNGLLVVDDELISSRAKDVETKTLSDRKVGKEGTVIDCVSCSLTNILYGSRLRVKGVSQADTVYTLIGTLPSLDMKSRLTFDRGYGKLPFCEEIIARGLHVSTFATTRGSRHPFIPSEEIEIYKQRLISKKVPENVILKQINTLEPWILHNHIFAGTETRMAKKNLSNGTSI